ncbi:MAG: glycoside-pentoside-hexuronide (GPH):cation symporter [Lachnospiraceae bacterium]|nr:glycoside-pentoside-hexuronide (GPH):cation symporter [Lachnospiraceae bacterium]
MNERKYLKWYNKVGYGSGDVAGNVVYAFLSSFVMIFLSDTVGLNPGVVGTLIMFSKLFDGVTDIFFGSMIDKTKSRMGKARPWMLWAYFGCAAMIVAIFAIPAQLGDFAKYAWFFIAYTALNAVFYTANNIAYSALTALITKNGSERVQMGSIRFMFAFGTSLLIQAVTVDAVKYFGGGAEGWRTVAIIYAVIGLIVNTISVLSVKELSDEELDETHSEKEIEAVEKYRLKDAAKMLVSNKYYLIICGVYVLTQIFTATLNMGIYFMKYILGDEGLLGTFALAINIPLICGLVLTPVMVKKMKGMYKINLVGYAIATIARGLVIAAAYMDSVPLMLLFSAVASIGMSPLQGDLNALIAEASDYTFHTKHKRIDGTMYSCTSLGVKIGGGIGTAAAGWLLAASGFVANAAVQSPSTINMLYVMYLWIPMAINLIITVLLSRLKVEQANAELLKQSC